MQYEELVRCAHEAKEKAYAPYSKFKVGAALLTKTGKIYTGCNIENASYGATNCAERTAIYKAVSEGETEIVAIAVVSSGHEFTYPCGICRQVIAEFMKDGELVFENSKGELQVISLKELFPYSFTQEDLLTLGGTNEKTI
ncbi:MAG: cytidine deaminase [Cellulosilyticaceae bacterium]